MSKGVAVTVRRLAAGVLLTVIVTLPLGYRIGSSMRLADAPATLRLALGEMLAMGLLAVLTMVVGGVLCIAPATRRRGDMLVRFGAGCALASLAVKWLGLLALAGSAVTR